MFIASIKIKKQTILTLILSFTIISLVLLIIPLSEKTLNVISNNTVPNCKNIEEITDWIKSLGWEIELNPFYTQKVKIPKNNDEIYSQYMINQRKNGYRVDKYTGKTVTQYKFKVLNFNSGKTEAYINILHYKNKIVCADICSPLKDGFMYPLKSFEELENN